MKQSEALDIMKMGYNVFLTGAAGSGKTFVLNEFIAYLKQHKIGVGITASTGIAATHLGGMTIHSWAGIGIKDEILPSQIDAMKEKTQLIKRFESTRVLIIDEVSMLHGIRLDLVDLVARAFKDPDKPFGGLQVILSGDLFQLPPVTREGETDWVFQSKAWQNMDLKVCYLQEQFRQDDTDLLDILNAIRSGFLEDYHFENLQKRFTSKEKDDITKLYTHNARVDEINQESLKSLDTDPCMYDMTTTGPMSLIEGMIASCLAPEHLELKVGAEVMFVANDQQQRFVNGTRGVVLDFDAAGLPVVETVEGKKITPTPHTWSLVDGEIVRASITQIPLRHAWAITVHKSQGMTLDAAEIDLSGAFEPGMGYVALSRVRTLKGLHIRGANAQALEVSPLIREFDAELRRQSRALSAGLQKLGEDKLKSNQERALKSLKPEDIEENMNQDLFEELRKWRHESATARSVPSYVILPDKSLKEIAAHMPNNLKDLRKVNGIGPQKLEQFGDRILDIVAQYSS